MLVHPLIVPFSCAYKDDTLQQRCDSGHGLAMVQERERERERERANSKAVFENCYRREGSNARAPKAGHGVCAEKGAECECVCERAVAGCSRSSSALSVSSSLSSCLVVVRGAALRVQLRGSPDGAHLVGRESCTQLSVLHRILQSQREAVAAQHSQRRVGVRDRQLLAALPGWASMTAGARVGRAHRASGTTTTGGHLSGRRVTQLLLSIGLVRTSAQTLDAQACLGGGGGRGGWAVGRHGDSWMHKGRGRGGGGGGPQQR